MITDNHAQTNTQRLRQISALFACLVLSLPKVEDAEAVLKTCEDKVRQEGNGKTPHISQSVLFAWRFVVS